MKKVLWLVVGALLFSLIGILAFVPNYPTDPGIRGGPIGAGGPISGLSENTLFFFTLGLSIFSEVDNVSGGLGPRFNMDSCGGCHAYPDIGGSSPIINPQIAVSKKNGALNEIPPFISVDGPVREVRYKYDSKGNRDGGVHALFTITGRNDAVGCSILQPDFLTNYRKGNLSFRIPTPVFGAGLIEAITDNTIIQNMNGQLDLKRKMGISGKPNNSGNDGTITRFGWKAQNKSLLIFAGEAYNVEQGVTNRNFPQERDETPGCLFNKLPEDDLNPLATTPQGVLSDIDLFSLFMRMLDAPTPADDNPSIINGKKLFSSIGCNLCHTPSLQSGPSDIPSLDNKTVNLYSDLLIHGMGTGLMDDIIQGAAGPTEFRTAPLWGVGQRIFFLHDGRTNDLLKVIYYHASKGSEANEVIAAFQKLPHQGKQDILNFLRSL